MINGAHTIIYASDAERARAFFRDVLNLPSVDAGGDWLIFKSPPAELAFHPSAAPESGLHALYFMCDNLETTMAGLADKGVEFNSEITEARWGRITSFLVPGAGEVGLYQPLHPLATDLD
ncbi:extradiol dioxygenase [Nocardia sp. SYP-A9097]|uniref:VOC family protein n=1 Tax=Nocardia sp. SYP-A9097 TaxID=2663237 RepID=UPI00129A68BC|nr:VOC family protein [Nocardia sp. SYP-A9097]MRH90571.1 extradiol dioxygenase [Nocardia sp. SYP-A9097]